MSEETVQIVSQKHEVFGRVRTVVIDDEPWFFAVDVAKALGYKKTRNAVLEHCEYAKNLNDFSRPKSRPLEIIEENGAVFTPAQSPKVIPEADVYSLVFGSKLEGAKKFKRWVVTEVLPAIRKHGAYIAKVDDFDLFPKILPATKAAVELAEMYGYEGNQAILTGSKVIRKRYGIDLPQMFEAKLPSPKQEKLLRVTDVGLQIGESAKATNQILRAMKLQMKKRRSNGSIEWNLTKRGKKYGVYLDVGKAHSDGTPIQQIKWYESVVPRVEAYLEDEDD